MKKQAANKPSAFPDCAQRQFWLLEPDLFCVLWLEEF